MIDLQPQKCNLCGGKVEYTTNAEIYGRTYGSGKCYLCRNCKAYVGTHEKRPTEAFGILANDEMRKWKIKCHSLFDGLWQFKADNKRRQYRSKCYEALAEALNITKEDCHFGYFDLDMLKKAYLILLNQNLKGVCYENKMA